LNAKDKMNGNSSSAQTSVYGDAAKHSWAHAVNSKEQLSKAIKSKLNKNF
jgi:hypothetical protein